MNGRNVFVAGGTSGINLALAQKFAARGDRVAVLSRSQEKVDAAVALLGEDSLGFAADVRDADAVVNASARTAAARAPTRRHQRLTLDRFTTGSGQT